MNSWTFEDEERDDILPGINLLANAQDAERRAESAANREQARKEWECRYHEARDAYRRRGD